MNNLFKKKTPIIYNIEDLCLFIRESNLIEDEVPSKTLEDYIINIKAWHEAKDPIDRKFIEQLSHTSIIDHYKALRWALRHCENDITWRWIDRVHYKLMKGHLGSHAAGLTRKENVCVGPCRWGPNGIEALPGGFIPPSYGEPLQIAKKEFQEKLDDFIINNNPKDRVSKKQEKLLFKKIYNLHCLFECVHPYIDGNGRSGRILWIALLHRYGFKFTYIPYNERKFYYNSIRDCSLSSDEVIFSWIPNISI